MTDIKKSYRAVFQTEEGKEVFNDILNRLGYREPIARIDQRAEVKAVALHDFAVELVRLVNETGEKT